MKAIILAAGEWKRLRPLTNTIPKPIIKIFWKTIIEHNLEHIYKYVSEIIIVVKYKADEVKKAIWDEYKKVKVSYREQSDKPWTAWAIMWMEDIKKDVIILNGDSIFPKKDLKKISEDFGKNLMPDLKGISMRELLSVYPQKKFPKYNIAGSEE